MWQIMNPNSSFDSPVRSQESLGDFMKPKFSPVFTSSPYQNKNISTDFIPFGPSPPAFNNRGRGQWRGNRNRSLLSNASSSGSSSFSSGMGHRHNSYSSNGSQRSSPYKQNSPYGNWRGRGGNKGHHKHASQNCNISAYYHPSMVEDPWADLEELLNNSQSSCSYSPTKETETGNNTQSSNTEQSVVNDTSVEISSQESVS